MSDERRCKNCLFWLQLAPEDISGQCRRFPPMLPQNDRQQQEMATTGAGPFAGVWPDTLGVDWCGEFQARARTIADEPLPALHLSARTVAALNKAGIVTVRELIRRTATDLREVQNFGKASLKEVREKLAARNLSLSGP